MGSLAVTSYLFGYGVGYIPPHALTRWKGKPSDEAIIRIDRPFRLLPTERNIRSQDRPQCRECDICALPSGLRAGTEYACVDRVPDLGWNRRLGGFDYWWRSGRRSVHCGTTGACHVSLYIWSVVWTCSGTHLRGVHCREGWVALGMFHLCSGLRRLPVV